jgi:hypothetical protein
MHHRIFKSNIPILNRRQKLTVSTVVADDNPITMFGKILKVKDEYQPDSNFINLGKLLDQEIQNCKSYRDKTKGLKKIRSEALALSLEGRLTFAAAMMRALRVLHSGDEMFISMEAEYINFDGFMNTVSFDVPEGVNWEEKFGLIGGNWKEGEKEYLLDPARNIEEIVPLLACLLLGTHDYDPNRPYDPTRLATFFSQAWPKPVRDMINNLMADMINLGRTPSSVENFFEKNYSRVAENCYSRIEAIKATYKKLSTLQQDSYFNETEIEVESNRLRSCGRR